jgi:hypothetical protein
MPAIQDELRAADVIWGFDPLTGAKMLFHGKALLERVAGTGSFSKLNVVSIPVDFASNEADELVAACLAFKGACCYEGAPESSVQASP